MDERLFDLQHTRVLCFTYHLSKAVEDGCFLFLLFCFNDCMAGTPICFGKAHDIARRLEMLEAIFQSHTPSYPTNFEYHHPANHRIRSLDIENTVRRFARFHAFANASITRNLMALKEWIGSKISQLKPSGLQASLLTPNTDRHLTVSSSKEASVFKLTSAFLMIAG